MAAVLSEAETVYFINCLRGFLRLGPLPSEGRWDGYAFSLDGERSQSAEAWAAELKIGRTTAIFRYQRLSTELESGRADAYQRATARGSRAPKPRRASANA